MQIRLTAQHRAIAQKYPYEMALYGEGGNGTLVFQPRDGTRYVIVFREIDNQEEGAILGHRDAPSSLVSLMRGSNRYSTAVFGDSPHRYYIEEKLGGSSYEAVVAERALRFLFDEIDPGPFNER